jgi:hypothetical protein
MQMNDNPLLNQLKIDAIDRQHQLWERNSLSIDLYTQDVLRQKLNYIHHNPLQQKWNLCSTPEDYFYSSALFYEKGHDHFNFLTHYNG